MSTHAHSTIDIHAHWYPQDWLRLIEKDGPAQGASLKRDGRKYHISTGRVTNAFDESFVALDERIAGMDRQHVDVQAMSLTTPMVYWAPPAFGLALAQCFNDSIAAAHAKVSRAPARAGDAADAGSEARAAGTRARGAKLPGMRGLYLATHVNGTELDDKAFWPIYAKAEELGWTIFLHPMDTIGPERTKKYYLKNLLGNPYDTGVAAASLVFGGVLDAFPKLEVNLPHAGGTFPWLIGRLDHGTQACAPS